MVLKNKHTRDEHRKSEMSGLAKKKYKQSYKLNKKYNYKKKEEKLVECSICFGECQDTSDNTISCGKVNHTICGDCKVKLKDSDCPMCRSHQVNQPKAQTHYLRRVTKMKKSVAKYQSDISRMSPKNIRNYNRSGPYYEKFHTGSNVLIRQRRQALQNPQTRTMLEYGPSTIIHIFPNGNRVEICGNNVTIKYPDGSEDTMTRTEYEEKNNTSEWFPDILVREYNGVIPDNEDSGEEEDYIYLTDIEDDD